MCTVSIVPDDSGFRLISNRDERRDRAVALQPRVEIVGSRCAIMPIDPAGGGSWIGINDAGLVAAVLNRHAEPSRDTPSVVSRGLIVRRALACDSLETALEAVQASTARVYRPFRLVLVQHRRIALIVGNGSEFASADSTLGQPYMFTASSLGDALVDTPRRRLFERLMENACARRQAQLLFHRHQWSDKREISVLMERDDAATVSRTVVEVTDQALALEYESLVPCGAVARIELQPC
jgi:hypothetical protein